MASPVTAKIKRPLVPEVRPGPNMASRKPNKVIAIPKKTIFQPPHSVFLPIATSLCVPTFPCASIFQLLLSSAGLAFLTFWKRATESAAAIKKSTMNKSLAPVKKAPPKNVNATRNTRTAKPCVEFDSIATSNEMILHFTFWKAAQHLGGHGETSTKATVDQD